MPSSNPPDELDTPEYWLSTLGDAQPLHTTLPTPGAPNELAKVEVVAAQLKTPLLAWQRYFIRVATEKNPDGSYRYPTVVLTVPRQSGKTTVVRALLTTRALLNEGRRAWITAQTGIASRDLLFSLADQVQRSAFGKTVTVRRAADSPRIEFHTGSRVASFSPTPESLHGKTFADALLDEIFAFDDAEGALLVGSITPAQQTIRDRQLIMVSTKGTPKSTFLNGWIDKGRASVDSTGSQVAYFEWALADGLDAFDSNNWDFHPGLHGGLITKEDIAAGAQVMTKGEFTRAFMNRQTETLESVLDLKKWDAAKAELVDPERSKVTIAYEVSYDRSRACIAVAWKHEGKTQVRILRNDSGTEWLAPTLTALRKANPLAIGADKYAQNAVIADALTADYPNVNLKMLKPEDYKTGSVAFKARIEDGTIQHDGHTALRSAIASAETRPMGEGWCFSHKSQPELVAVVTACRLLDEVRAVSKPMLEVWD